MEPLDGLIVGLTPPGRTGAGSGKVLVLQTHHPEKHVSGFAGHGQGVGDALTVEVRDSVELGVDGGVLVGESVLEPELVGDRVLEADEEGE